MRLVLQAELLLELPDERMLQRPPAEQQAAFAELEAAQQTLEALLERWMQLEEGEV